MTLYIGTQIRLKPILRGIPSQTLLLVGSNQVETIQDLRLDQKTSLTPPSEPSKIINQTLIISSSQTNLTQLRHRILAIQLPYF